MIWLALAVLIAGLLLILLGRRTRADRGLAQGRTTALDNRTGAPADSGRLFCLSVQPGSFQGTREVFMAMLDLDQLTPFQRLTVERALVLAQQLEATAEAAPHGQIIHRIESHLLGNGRDFLRKTLEDSLQSRVDALEKKGHPHKLVLAVKPDATKADPNAR